MTFYYLLGSFLGVLFFGTMIVYFIIFPIVVLINLLSVPSPKIKDRDWRDIFAVDN